MWDSIDWMIEVACGLIDALAEHLRPALPGDVLRGVDALLVVQRLVEVAVGAFERPHEGPLLGPAVPFLVLLLHFQRIGLVVADARGLDHVCHAALLLASATGHRARRAAKSPLSVISDCGGARNRRRPAVRGFARTARGTLE